MAWLIDCSDWISKFDWLSNMLKSGWSMEGLTDRLIDWLIDWLIDCNPCLAVARPVVRPFFIINENRRSLFVWLTGWLFDGLTDWTTDGLIGGLIDTLAAGLFVGVFDWLIVKSFDSVVYCDAGEADMAIGRLDVHGFIMGWNSKWLMASDRLMDSLTDGLIAKAAELSRPFEALGMISSIDGWPMWWMIGWLIVREVFDSDWLSLVCFRIGDEFGSLSINRSSINQLDQKKPVRLKCNTINDAIR